ncbi:MAG: hypothetical protein ABIP51_18095 [Bacteroidia bacterium]
MGKAIILHLILTSVYLTYERIWNKVQWGKIVEENLISQNIEISEKNTN